MLTQNLFKEPTFAQYFERYLVKMNVPYSKEIVPHLLGVAGTAKTLLATVEANPNITIGQLLARFRWGLGLKTLPGMGAQFIGGSLKITGAFYIGVVFGCLLCAALDYLEYQRGAARYRPSIPNPRRLSIFEIQEILNSAGELAHLDAPRLNRIVNTPAVVKHMKNPVAKTSGSYV